MIKKLILPFIILVVVALGGRMIWLGKNSPSMKPKDLGLVDGQLRACGSKPNCVSSLAKSDSKFFIEPITGENIEGLWDNLNMLLPEMGFELKNSEEDYLHFTETSNFFGFVDDIEFHLLRDQGVIQMRSRSRVGYSDLGVNRKRLEKIRKALQPKGS